MDHAGSTVAGDKSTAQSKKTALREAGTRVAESPSQVGELLAKFDDSHIIFVSPPVVAMREDIKDYLTRQGVRFEERANLHEVAAEVDVIYQTRIQRERFHDINEYEQVRGRYIIDKSVMDCLRESAIVMHPLPRVDEINSEEVDRDPRAAYFRQAHNGLYVRMALLKMILAV